MLFSPRRLGRRVGLATAAVLTLPLVALPSSAVAADAELASGRNWSVSQAPGGYLVTVDLDKKLPVVSDAPTIEVDGAPIGLATESADGTSLTVFTTDASVTKADDIEAGWFSKPSGQTAPARTSAAAVAPMVVDAETLDADPSSLGKYEITESVYNFGAQAIDLAAIGGVRGEMQGKIYLPKTGGARPTVILLHGRHTSCSTGTTPATRWPCNPGQINVPSFAGYDGTARALASHGYAVVSVAANAINSNDNQLALDQGAQARGQLLLDTLSMLDDASKNQPVSYYDAQTGKDVSLAEALADQSPLPGLTQATQPMTPADLVGRFDLTNVGMMGHSRGGEGVTSAATLNQALDKPWGIKSILPLAPVDFARMTVPNVAMNVILPYCDGDVSNQQGQHMLDDSRYAFDDDSLRSGVWAMGANHNFFNTVWTPGVYGYSVSDDWSASTDAVCGSRAATNIRMTAQEQYDMGTAYMAGWFRLTLGGEKQFLPMFDGSGEVPAVLNGEDVRSVSTAPASARKTITSFESTSSLVRPSGSATATVCASAAGRTVPQALPSCTTSINTSAAPHWTPASNGGNVPATPVTKLAWTALTSGQTASELRVSVPSTARKAAGMERLSVKIAADESVPSGTDLTLSVLDAQGATYSSKVSALNPLAVNRLPASATSALLKKLVLQQVNVPVSTLKAAGLDVSDIREVRFTAATGADGTPAGAIYLSDLAFESSSVGTPAVKTEPTINVHGTSVAEGDAPGTADIAVYLDKKAARSVTGYVSVLGSATGRGGITMEKVTFAPGETCKVVSAPILGDKLPSSTNSTVIKTSVINTSGAVMGAKALTNLEVREDDGVTGSAGALPAAGVQGDACAELAASRATGSVTSSDTTPAPGETVTVTASGYRVGEAVTVSLGATAVGVATADGSGTATLAVTVPATAATGVAAVTAVGSGSGYTSTGSVEVLTETATTLALSPATPGIGEKVTLTASVTGADTAGPVEFFDGATSLGTASTVDGVATLVLDGLKAGTHELTAVFGQTASAQSSTSNIAAVTLEKGKSSIALVLAADSTVYGSGVKGSVAVANGDGGTVTVTYGGKTFDVRLGGSDSAAFTLPAGLAVGTYTVSAVFNGTDRVEASGVATAGYRVTKAATTASISAKSSVKRGKKLTVKTTVRGATGGTHPTGRVKVYVKTGKGKYVLKKTVTLSAAKRGVVKATVKVTKKKGTVRVKTVYSGDASFGGATSATKTVRIK
ncbi:Ig-like domain repeat protein [Aeromicrobium wangtongii]|uniref:Ig-like domain repeat protein n=1 Tax=Aeromicrobium wangtongii TaxID=2969247 RepID=UPI002017A6D6|nr:Ig-like domain repeat protein [Aeromicrobium wangtongii]MCL3816906.1 Ig-like domain repeat protein [Aeromicrobium wangtongii]